MPGKSSIERAIVVDEESTEALKHSHFSAPVNKIGNSTLEALNKLSTIFNAATESYMEPTNDFPPPTPPSQCRIVNIPKDTNGARLPRVAQPTPPVVNTVPAPRMTVTEEPSPDASLPHIIPDDSDTYPRIDQTPQRTQKGPHVILDVDECDATQRYIHKYNTCSAPKYAFAVAALQAQQFQHKAHCIEHQINHVLHPITGKPSTYK